jgi:hypothetical protein
MKRLAQMLAVALCCAACLPAGAEAAFGIDNFDVTFTGPDGSPAMQAGSHPYAFTTSLGTNTDGTEPEGRLRELFLDLPPGLVVSTTAVPRCKEADFETLIEGKSNCSDVTAVGITQTASGAPEDWTMAPVFNLVPPPGVPVRLGFRLAGAANVVVDFELSPEPPYRLLASVGEIPEAIELFAAELQLWGVPASPEHDRLRGRCAVEGGAGSCPALILQRPLLTLPTSCKGPQATFYEAFSWEGDEDWGSVLTHDGAGDPLGSTGCDKLGFSPSMTAAPTTSEAQSPTGLDLSIDVHDEGLLSPSGIAESQIRDVVLNLPEGMTANPGALEGLDVCSEEDLAGETLQATPGEGCPEPSRIGTVEVESPLAAGSVEEGVLYLATPFEALAEESFLAFYLVIKSPSLGIVIKQVVELEPDPESGQLVVYVEDIPQLPFSHFSLHLDDGGGGPLISPPLCGSYLTRAEFTPWADDSAFVVTSAFEIVSGPAEGPCPSPDDPGNPGNPSVEPGVDGGSSGGAASPLATPGAPAGVRPAGGRSRRCAKGKRRVRRHGRVRCVPKHRGKHGRGDHTR